MWVRGAWAGYLSGTMIGSLFPRTFERRYRDLGCSLSTRSWPARVRSNRTVAELFQILSATPTFDNTQCYTISSENRRLNTFLSSSNNVLVYSTTRFQNLKTFETLVTFKTVSNVSSVFNVSTVLFHLEKLCQKRGFKTVETFEAVLS